jgi:hypothetical protein
MRKTNTRLLIAFIMLFAIPFVFTGCKKADTPVEDLKAKTKSVLPPGDDLPDDPPPLGPSVQDLKLYFARQINVDVNDISFNEATNQFILFGRDQINLEDLTNSFNENPYSQNVE